MYTKIGFGGLIYMALHIISGDILKIDAEAIVIPANPRVCVGRLLDKKAYEMAGFDEMMAARRAIGEISVGKAKVTPAFALKAKYVIHAVTPPWTGGYSDEPRFLTDCFCNSLKLATEIEVKSVAFPLLGAGSNRVPVLKAKTIAEDTINGWLRSHKSQLDVYLVLVPADFELLKEHLNDDVYINHEPTFEEKRESELKKYLKEHPQKNKADFLKERVQQYINRFTLTNAEIARAILRSESTISRLKNGETNSPNRNTVISVAIYLKLSKEERSDFMYCYGYVYPQFEMEFNVEEIIKSGITDFIQINNILSERNPHWILSSDNDGIKKTSKTKAVKNKN
jgi:O-acetyl-ADP-ribose deacetylase (regulator of RNase III)/transcriptional regulator with XRE-family HTH domain